MGGIVLTSTLAGETAIHLDGLNGGVHLSSGSTNLNSFTINSEGGIELSSGLTALNSFTINSEGGIELTASPIKLNGPIIYNVDASAITSGVIPLTTVVTLLRRSDEGVTATIDAGTNGQFKIITLTEQTAPGSIILTDASGTTTPYFNNITFTVLGDTASLVYIDPKGWIVSGFQGATVALPT